MVHGGEVGRTRAGAVLNLVRSGRGSALVIRGDIGTGKTTLLAHLVERADDLRVLRANGTETESQLAYGGLHQLLGPLTDHLAELPTHPRAVLRAALGLSRRRDDDLLTITGATLAVLRRAAAERPLLCLVDDVHRLDRASAEVMTAVARRLRDEAIGMVLAADATESATAGLAGLPQHWLEPFDDETARRLVLDEIHGHRPALAVVERIVAVGGGNPWALVELSRSLTPEQITGDAPLNEPLAVSQAATSRLVERFGHLSEHARALLMLISADEDGRWTTVRLAALLLDIEPEALDELELSGLVRNVDGRLVIPQPLVRSVAYRTATTWQRRSAHLGLAEALEGADAPDARAWHLAAAAEGFDDEVAEELERSGLEARTRSGHAVASAALERAADLTRDERERARRLVAAAEASWLAGRTQRMALQLDRVEQLPIDPSARASVALLRGSFELEYGSMERSYAVLLEGGRQALASEPLQALELLARAAEAAWWSGNVEWARALGTLAASVPLSERDDETFLVELLVGTAEIFHGEYADGAAALERALDIADTFDHPRYLVSAATAAVHLGDHARGRRHLERAIAQFQTTGAIGELPLALQYLAAIDIWQGRIVAAREHGSEGLRIAQESRQDTCSAFHLAILALVDATAGDEAACRARAQEALDLATHRQLPAQAGLARWALGRLELGLGRPHEALVHLGALSNWPHPAHLLYAVPELVEAAVLAGEPQEGEAAYRRLHSWAQRSGTVWSSHAVAALEGWRTPGAAADVRFERAKGILFGRDLPFDEGKLRLNHAQNLRDRGELARAREEARTALRLLEHVGAKLWTQRARRMLDQLAAPLAYADGR